MQNPGSFSFCNQFETQNTIFRKIHVRFEYTRTSPMECFALEVGSKRSLTKVIVLQCDVSIGGESTRQYGNKPEYTFEWLIEDITHFVFEVLSRDKWIEQVLPEGSLHRHNFTTGSSDIGV